MEFQDKLQHEMYWNLINFFQETTVQSINYNMRCIETSYPEVPEKKIDMINYNMRCIETMQLLHRSKRMV